ncbi:MAG TPA: hypothetical protein VEV38_03230 [Candidatus Eremiobacteraceae bacterium]|nr:hypothetical protein [Candidatus Eremiobacteraceae bacterium]
MQRYRSSFDFLGKHLSDQFERLVDVVLFERSAKWHGYTQQSSLEVVMRSSRGAMFEANRFQETREVLEFAILWVFRDLFEQSSDPFLG